MAEGAVGMAERELGDVFVAGGVGLFGGEWIFFEYWVGVGTYFGDFVCLAVSVREFVCGVL